MTTPPAYGLGVRARYVVRADVDRPWGAPLDRFTRCWPNTLSALAGRAES